MNWKEQLTKFEKNKDWESAIILLQNTISEKEGNLDAYLSMNYLLMNILVEENYSSDKHDYYAGLIYKYFIESYTSFCHNPKYLFYIGKIACVSEWYFNIEIEEVQNLLKTAHNLDPENVLYQWANYNDLDMRNIHNRNSMVIYANQALSEPMVREELKSQGSLGKYLLDGLEYWSKKDITK